MVSNCFPFLKLAISYLLNVVSQVGVSTTDTVKVGWKKCSSNLKIKVQHVKYEFKFLEIEKSNASNSDFSYFN